MHRVRSCFGIFLQKTSGGDAVLDFEVLQKLQVKLARDFFRKRLHDMSSFGVCKCLFFLRTDVSAMQKLMAWIDDC
jgi:hypothetical protein